MMTRPGFSSSTMPLRIFATASGSTTPSTFTRMPRSAPMASAVRIVSAACCGPIDTATISVAALFSLSRIASSTAISSKGFIDILTFANSTPEPSALTRTLTLKSTTRLTGTKTFMRKNSVPARRANYGYPFDVSTRSPAPLFRRNISADIHRIARPHALEQWQFRAPQEHHQHRPSQQAPDMCPPCGVTPVGRQNIPNLRQDPKPENPGRAEPQRQNAEGKHQNSGAGPQHEISGDHTGNRARGSDQRYRRVGINEYMHEPAGSPAQEIEEQKPY